MADISKVNLNGTELDVKDATARDTLNALGGTDDLSTATVGDSTTPVYLSEGVLTAGRGLTFKAISNQYTYTTATSLSYTGVSITIPANSYFSIVIRTFGVSISALSIGTSTSSFSANATESFAFGGLTAQNNVCPIAGYVSEETTLYIWATNSASGSTGYLWPRGFYITLS